MQNHANWRRMPLFVASTFRDMHYERDLIHRVVVPSVNTWLRDSGRGVSIYAVDLRWGIETDDRLDPELREHSILNTCVAEVRRCHPLFLGLIGDRYGWIPPASVSADVINEAGLADIPFPLSVTAIEMLTAAEESAASTGTPIYMSRRIFDGADSSGSDDDMRHITYLENHLCRYGFEPLRYECQRDPINAQLTSDTFTTQLVKALINVLDDSTSVAPETSWLDSELQEQRWAAEREAAQFVGRAEDLKAIDNAWNLSPADRLWSTDRGNDSNHPIWQMRYEIHDQTIAVVGESGSGKTALLAKAARDLPMLSSAEHILDVTMTTRAYVQVGTTPASARLPVCILLLLAQFDWPAAQAISERHTPDDLTLADVLGPWLGFLSKFGYWSGPVVIVDGLDRITGALTDSLSFAWMPTTMRDKARFLVSAVDGEFAAGLLHERPSTRIHRLADLDVADAATLIVDRVAAHHKQIPNSVVHQLVSTSTGARWLVVATDLLLTLMKHDYRVLTSRAMADLEPEEAIRAVVHSVALQLPRDLDELHAEALDRITDLDEWLVFPLCVLGATLHGLRHQDLAAILASLGQGNSDADLAFARDVLSAFIDTRGDQWSFVHLSAYGASLQMLDEAGEAVGADVLAGYRTGVAGYLSTLPVDDPVRCAELPTLLAVTDNFANLAVALGNPELSTNDTVKIFASTLATLARSGMDIEFFVDMIDGATDDAGAAVLIPILAANIAPALAADDARTLVTSCRRRAAEVDAGVVSRFGHHREDVIRLLDELFPDLVAHNGSLQPMQAWLREGMQTQRAALCEAPEIEYTGSTTRSNLALIDEMTALAGYAIGAATGILPRANEGDATLARCRLDRWRNAPARHPESDADSEAFIRTTIDIAARACALAWPHGGFTVADDDFDRLLELNDRLRGNLDAAALLGSCARIRALDSLRQLSIGVQGFAHESCDEITGDEDAAVAHSAIGYLEEALWQMRLQRVFTPDSAVLQQVTVGCGMLLTHLLELCGQAGSAVRAGLEACQVPPALELLGWDAFAVRAASTLMAWFQWGTDIDPRPVISRLRDGMDNYGVPGNGEVEVDYIELPIFVTSIMAGLRYDDFDLAEAALERGLELSRAGLLTMPQDELIEGVRELINDAEDELVEIAIDSVESATGPEDLLDTRDQLGSSEVLVEALDGVHRLRSQLIASCGAHPADVSSAAFCLAFGAAIRNDSDRALAARKVIAAAPGTGIDERTATLRQTTHALLESLG